jgi:DNA-binding SARP family transcriptional activator/tetratricopeptide (TPR) repeat protein/DNA polymerase III delta prime subunit
MMFVRFAVLGSLHAVDDDGAAVALGGPKARALLAVLLLEPDRTVPVDTVMAALWGEEPPPTATASLHNHVSRLRRSLRDAGGERLRTLPHGLRLRVGEGELDRAVFEERLRRALAARDGEDWEAAEREAAGALTLWRGTPFADVPALAGHPVVAFLEEQRLRALECRFEALLRLDRLDGLAAELSVLVEEHPFRESLHRQLILALGRTDRRAEALAVFRSLRRALVEELGVEPGAAVQEAHQEVLRGADGEPSRGVAQLPAPPREFVGRDRETAELRAALESAGGGTAVAVISGMPGVGKTGLALHVARQLRPAFPDGQLCLNLHGATPGVTPLEPVDALSALLRGLGVDARRIPGDTEAASALLRSVLAPTRTLLVLDDAASVSQVRPLLPAGDGCAVLVTSRRPLATLEAAAHLRLDPLSPRDSVLLLERASGRSWTASDSAAVTRLVALCGQLPLALRVSAARLGSRRSLPVAKLVERLARHEERLDHLELEDLSVRRSLLAAHEALLTSGDPVDADAATALVLVGALDLPEYGAPLIATALDRPERTAERALERLAEVALLQETGWGRYVPHDLVRDFARELAGQAGTGAAVERSLHWYQERLAQCAAALRPASWPAPEAVPPVFADTAAALDWGDTEAANLLALAGSGTHAHGRLGATRALDLISALFPYLHDRGRAGDLERLTRHAITLARSSGNTAAEGRALGHLASAHYSAGRLRQALLLLDEAVELSERLHDDAARRRHLGNRAALLRELGRGAEARATLARCLALRPDHLTPGEEAVLLGHQGYVAELTDLRAALAYHLRSRELARQAGSAVIEQVALCNTGRAQLRLGEPDRALRSFDQALRVMATGVAHWNAERETRLGRTQALRTLGRLGQAGESCAELLRETTARGDSYGHGLAEYEYGHVLDALGDHRAALDRWQNARATLEGTDAPLLPDLRALTSAPPATADSALPKSDR